MSPFLRLTLCIAVCERRPDVARGEVAEGDPEFLSGAGPGVVGFLVRMAVSEEWRSVKEAFGGASWLLRSVRRWR